MRGVHRAPRCFFVATPPNEDTSAVMLWLNDVLCFIHCHPPRQCLVQLVCVCVSSWKMWAWTHKHNQHNAVQSFTLRVTVEKKPDGKAIVFCINTAIFLPSVSCTVHSLTNQTFHFLSCCKYPLLCPFCCVYQVFPWRVQSQMVLLFLLGFGIATLHRSPTHVN